MGITGFLKSGEEGFITEQSIISFMLGIGFALISSLTGLWLTTHNNHLAAEIDDEVQKDKSDFFYFLQTEVIGKIPTTVQETLSQLNGTISSLNSEFRTVIGDLKETFGSLSKDFGDSLSGNLNRIDSTVNLLGNNIESIGEIFNQQKEIIDKMLTAEYTTVLKK
ncbi:MAG: hypothetical protein LIP01_00310 [Tannerellaceae bacterium]|nr:hypothetical protein [Tannerellaceae bacterium]